MMDNSADIDIDLADRTEILDLITCWPAAQKDGDKNLRRHNSGVYFTPVPYDPVLKHASQDYQTLADRGYFKIDLLNQSVYTLIKDPDHYREMRDRPPPWHRLKEQGFVEQVTQINAHYRTLAQMPEPVDTLARMAMFIAVIRPGKRHLVGKTWKEIAQDIWTSDSEGYTFKKSHSVAYAHLVVLHMNLLDSVGFADQSNATTFATPADLA